MADLAEQFARQIFDLGAANSPDDAAHLLRRVPGNWEVRLFRPYELVVQVTSESIATCTLRAMGGRADEGYRDYSTQKVSSADEVQAFFAEQLRDWPARRDRLSGKV